TGAEGVEVASRLLEVLIGWVPAIATVAEAGRRVAPARPHQLAGPAGVGDLLGLQGAGAQGREQPTVALVQPGLIGQVGLEVTAQRAVDEQALRRPTGRRGVCG